MTSVPLTRAEAGLTPRYRGVDLFLNQDIWKRLSAENELLTDQDWARRLGIEATSVWRLRTGRIGPSSRTIAALGDLLGKPAVLELFDICKVAP